MSTKPEVTKETTEAMLAMASFSPEAMQSASEAYLSMYKNFSRIQMEMLQFMADRLQKDFAHPLRLMNCRKPEEFIEAQLDFANTFFADYAREGRSLTSMLSPKGKDN